MPHNLNSQPSTPYRVKVISIEPAKLTIGMYVDLNCSWFQHPFASKTFKIQTERELATIRSLGLPAVLVDLSLSDRETSVIPVEKPHTKTDNTMPVQAASSDNSALTQPAITRYKESLQQADQQYKQTLSQGSKALSDIGNGSEAGLTTAKEMVNGLTDLILDEAASSAMSSLLGAQDLQDPSVLHAMNVSVLSMLVGKQFDLSQDQMKMLGMAGLLHDIGEQRLTPPLLTKDRNALSDQERKSFQQHIEHGIEMLGQYPGLPDLVPDIIRQHHERIDGSGYPKQLEGSQISMPARILMVVDEYESLINAPDVRNNLTPTEALSKLYQQGKRSLSEEVVVALIQILSVYPPGTVVELTDKSVGLVISINLHARMRPIVILHSQTADRDNPIITDLGQDQGRSIARSLAKHELSPEQSSYLNLSRWTGYFINSSMEALKEAQAA
jgi:putative nucleotidyltransferase with HDIG domain